MMAKLLSFVCDCPSKKPELAAEGELHYNDRKKQVKRLSMVRASEITTKSETITDENGSHEAKDATNSEACALSKSSRTKSKASRPSATGTGVLEHDKSPSQKALWLKKSERNKDEGAEREKMVEQYETAVIEDEARERTCQCCEIDRGPHVDRQELSRPSWNTVHVTSIHTYC